MDEPLVDVKLREIQQREAYRAFRKSSESDRKARTISMSPLELGLWEMLRIAHAELEGVVDADVADGLRAELLARFRPEE